MENLKIGVDIPAQLG
ncbi:hypothetical protein SEA_SOLOSIS_100 [Mycobacterium phage Solosis]|nr:hypothetical protein SEA_SOLOSIS_100 [Mycobacterium phage Solosis]